MALPVVKDFIEGVKEKAVGAEVLRSVGIVPASRDTAHQVLEQGHKLLVFPGGAVVASREPPCATI